MFLLARVYFVPTDPGIYITAAIFVTLTQLLIWSIARYSTDIEIWRCLALCAAGIISIIGLSMGGLNGLLGGYAAGAFVAFLIAGFLYDFETWQRITVSAVTPILGIISFIAGYWLKGIILTKLLGSATSLIAL